MGGLDAERDGVVSSSPSRLALVGDVTATLTWRTRGVLAQGDVGIPWTASDLHHGIMVTW